MSRVFRRYVIAFVVALGIALVPLHLIAQTRPVGSVPPVGQLSIDGGPPVPIYSFGFAATNTLSTGLPGGTGKAQLSEVSFTKQSDALSTALFRHVVMGTHLPSVRIEIFQTGAATVGATFNLTDVVLTSFKVSGGDAVESVSMAFDRIALTVGGQSFCWDVSANLAC